METIMTCKQTRVKNHSIMAELAALYLAFFFSFGYFFNMYYLAVLFLLISIISAGAQAKIFINFRLLVSISLLGMIWLISSLYSYEMPLALKYTFFCFLVFISLILLRREVYESSLRYFMILCAVHISIIIIQYFSYSTVDALAIKILTTAQYSQAQAIYSYCGALAGITGQTGQAALYCVTFIFCANSYAKQKRIYYALLIPAFIALFLTQKRSFLFLSMALTIVSILSGIKQSTRKYGVIAGVMWMIVVLAVASGGYLIIDKFFDISGFLSKAEKGSLSGRDILWKDMFALFVERPLFGVGFYSTDNLLGMTGHNIYLQLLCENGLFGAVPFYVAIIYFSGFVLCLKTKEITSTFSKLNFLFMILYGFLGNPIYEFTHIIIILMSVVYLKNFNVR